MLLNRSGQEGFTHNLIEIMFLLLLGINQHAPPTLFRNIRIHRHIYLKIIDSSRVPPYILHYTVSTLPVASLNSSHVTVCMHVCVSKAQLSISFSFLELLHPTKSQQNHP